MRRRMLKMRKIQHSKYKLRPTRTSRPFFSWSTFTWPLSLCQSLLTTRVLRRPPNFAFCFQTPTSFHWVGCQSKVTFMSEPVAQCWQLFSGNFYNLVPRRQQQQRGVSRCIVYHFCHTHTAVSSRTQPESEWTVHWTAHQLNCKWQHHLSLPLTFNWIG